MLPSINHPSSPTNNCDELKKLFSAANKQPNLVKTTIANATAEGLTTFLQPLKVYKKVPAMCLLSYLIFKERYELAGLMVNKIEKEEKAQRSLTIRDENGLTPLHYAALNDTPLYKRLKRIPACRALYATYCESPSMHRKIARLSKKPLGGENARFYFRPTGHNEDLYLTAEEIISRFGASFTAAPKDFSHIAFCDKKLLLRCPFKKKQTSTFAAEYEHFIQGVRANKNHSLAIRTVIHDDKGHPVPKEVGSGTFARENLDPLTTPCEYPGVTNKSSESNFPTTYTLHIGKDLEIESFEIRGYASSINHSFPNCSFKSHVLHGHKTSIILVRDPVKKDEELCVSYGEAYHTKNDKFVELRPKAMEEFVQAVSIRKFNELLKNEWSIRSPENNIIYKWEYILYDTPVSFIRLILTGFISVDDAEFILKEYARVSAMKEEEVREQRDITLREYAKHLMSVIDEKVVSYCINLMKTAPEKGRAIAARLVYTHYDESRFMELVGKK